MPKTEMPCSIEDLVLQGTFAKELRYLNILSFVIHISKRPSFGGQQERPKRPNCLVI